MGGGVGWGVYVFAGKGAAPRNPLNAHFLGFSIDLYEKIFVFIPPKKLVLYAAVFGISSPSLFFSRKTIMRAA